MGASNIFGPSQKQSPGQFSLPPTVSMAQRVKRPVLLNPDGGFSTERTITVNDPALNEGRFTVIPTIVNGKPVEPAQAVRHAIRTGEHYGAFDSNEQADADIAVTHAILARMTERAASEGWQEALGTDPKRTMDLRKELRKTRR